MSQASGQQPQPPSGPKVTLAQVDQQIKDDINCWQTNGSSYFQLGNTNRFGIHMARINTPCERDFLIISKFGGIYGLEYDALRKLPILLLDTQSQQTNFDHYYYWAFAVDVLDFFQKKISNVYDKSIQDRVHLLMDVLFLSPKTFRKGISHEQDRIDRASEYLVPTLNSVRGSDFLIAAHLAYPLIEGIGRRLLPSLIEIDGSVKAPIGPFTSVDGKNVQYAPSGRNQVSAIDNLLRIVEHSTSNSQLITDLKEFRDHFDAMYSPHHPQNLKAYDMISEYRNSLLHGEELWQILYAAMINLIFLLLTSLVTKSDYDTNYDALIKEIEHNYQSRGSHWSKGYYPP